MGSVEEEDEDGPRCERHETHEVGTRPPTIKYAVLQHSGLIRPPSELTGQIYLTKCGYDTLKKRRELRCCGMLLGARFIPLRPCISVYVDVVRLLLIYHSSVQ